MRQAGVRRSQSLPAARHVQHAAIARRRVCGTQQHPPSSSEKSTAPRGANWPSSFSRADRMPSSACRAPRAVVQTSSRFAMWCERIKPATKPFSTQLWQHGPLQHIEL